MREPAQNVSVWTLGHLSDMHTAQLEELTHNRTARQPDALLIITRRYVSEPLMSHHSTPALAIAAALALTGVSVPALAASPQPGGVLPANPTHASSTDAQSGTRV